MTQDTSIPLYKRGSRGSSVASRKTLLSHSRTISQEQITPPPTPRDSQSKSRRTSSEQDRRSSGSSNKSLSQTKSDRTRSSAASWKSLSMELPIYMRAFYPFRATRTTDSSTVTVPLTPGDVVMIHNIHSNGWADGTTLASGARGWLPTNFCAKYEVDQIQALLRASVVLFEECRTAASTDDLANASQTIVADVVNGVRHLLEITDCLTRDALNVQSADSIRQTRKTLLSELSVLVKTARRMADEFGVDLCDYDANDLIDELMLSNFRVVLRAVHFLDAWTEVHEPADDDNFVGEDVATIEEGEEGEEDAEEMREEEDEHPADSTITIESSTETTPLEPAAKEKPQALTIITPIYDGQTSFLALTPASTVKGSEGECELMDKLETQTQDVLASARLNITYDSLLSCLATYIGTIHLKAPLPSRLVELTNDAVEVGNDLLEVVDHIRSRNGEDAALDSCKDTLNDEIKALVSEAQGLVKPLQENEDEAPLAGDESQPLIDAATKCVQGATLCFDAAHVALETVGDFEITITIVAKPVSQIGIGITTTVPTAPVVDGLNSPVAVTPETQSPVLTKVNLDKSLPLLPAVASPGATQTSPPPPPPAKDIPMSRRGSESTIDVSVKRRSALSTTGTLVSMKREDSRQSEVTDEYQGSTRATTPIHDDTPLASPKLPLLSKMVIPAHPTVAEMQMDSIPPTPLEEKDNPMLQKSHAHRLVFNKEGQLIGGSLPALIERMTMPDARPDGVVVNSFFLTFRHFSSPLEITQTLIERFDEASGHLRGSDAARLRVFNIFKQWLETHWKKDSDIVALPVIRDFAMNKLRPVLSSSADRLLELTDKVIHLSSDASLVPREAVTLQKSRSAISLNQMNLPEPRVTRGQYNILKQFSLNGGEAPGIIEFDPWEIARQLTLKESKLFCSIAPDELLGKEWQKKDSRAVNVRAMSTLSTEITHFVAWSIMSDGDPKKRAAVIKHWIKIADKCLELANYNCLMAIMCSLNTSTILRLKRTWEVVSPKSKAALEKLRQVIDCSKNYSELRGRLRNHLPPCLPFLGIYLTDLTFCDDGNPDKRPFPEEDPKAPTAINFDKYQKISKMIMELQHFQAPYPIQEVPELQTWIDGQLKALRESGCGDVQKLYRQSLALEPRQKAVPTVEDAASTPVPAPVVVNSLPEKTGFLGWAHSIKEKSSIASFNLAMSTP